MTKSILITDRESEAATRLYEFLSSKKFKVFVASSGRETIDALHNYLVDALLLDAATPIIPPTDFLLKLRQMKFRVPCFVVGGEPLIRTSKLQEQLGPVTQIDKPIDLLRLSRDLQIVTQWNPDEHVDTVSALTKIRRA